MLIKECILSIHTLSGPIKTDRLTLYALPRIEPTSAGKWKSLPNCPEYDWYQHCWLCKTEQIKRCACISMLIIYQKSFSCQFIIFLKMMYSQKCKHVQMHLTITIRHFIKTMGINMWQYFYLSVGWRQRRYEPRTLCSSLENSVSASRMFWRT